MQADWSFCEALTPTILMYYGPQGDFVRLGLFIEQHSGWSALAFGGNGGMKGAQQFVVRKVDGAFVAEERYSTDYVTPALQPTQEVALIFANEESGNTAWGILIPKSTCNAGERYPVEDFSRFMHWALGSSHEFLYHTSRGQFHANLLTGPMTLEDFSNAKNVSFEMPNVPVVMGAGGHDEKNPYVCGMFDLSQMLPSDLSIDSKHHVAMFSPVLDPNSVQYVHHMILYACDDGVFQHLQVIPECESMPPGCNQMKWPWAVGSEPIVFPAEAGMPMGEGKKWFALQMHYYNPSLDTGVMDSSGVRVTFANTLRTHDAATFRFNGGTGDNQRDPIPAGQSEYTLSPKATVPASCTNTWNVEEINVLGVVYHAHLVGKNLNIDVMRGDQLVGKLRREKLYDFNHQSLEPASVSKIKRGDQLVLSCTYDTSTRTGPTTFGDFTQTEMCWSAFMYYPAQSMNRAVYYGGISMMCQGGGGVKTIQGNTVPAESCSTVGDFTSDAGKELLQSLGINATAFLNNYQYVSTSEGTYLSSSASIMSSVIPFVLQAVILFAERA